jgi:hypothetical protein
VQEASEHEGAARWEQAEAAYRRILTLAEAEGNQAALFKAHDDLRTLFAMRGLGDQALQEAQAAVAAALKTDLAALQVAAWQGLFQCHLIHGDLKSAAATAEQAVQITSGETSLLRARALLMRARCRTEQALTSESEEDLAGAWQILAPQAQATLFAGVQSSLAVWWDVTARIRARAQDLAGAAEAKGKAVEFRRTVSHLPQLEGPYKYHALAKELQEYSVVLMAAGNAEAARAAFDESREIQQRIGTVLPSSKAA